VPGIELADVAAPELLHQARNGTGFGRSQQQTDVVVHEHIGV